MSLSSSPSEIEQSVAQIASISAVPTILEVICRTTGMGFAAVARVTDDKWIACEVRDQISFGLKPGGELQLESTICHEIRQNRQPVVIDHVSEDAIWCGHHTPAQYGFQSYISMPIILADGSFFGTLCAIDPRPARVSTPEVTGMFRLFAELISKHLDTNSKLARSESELSEEREIAALRDQFIAVLGHDLRAPVNAVRSLSELLLRREHDSESTTVLQLMRDSSARMHGLIENLLDLARGRFVGGIPLKRGEVNLEPVLQEVLDEVRAGQPDRAIDVALVLDEPVDCDPGRLAQLFSNLLNNALVHGSALHPVVVQASSTNGKLNLSVSNKGQPIPPNVRQRLFQPFYRNNNREGLGLGLFIANEIATAHGGTLSVRSEPDETCFTFSFSY